MRPTLGSFASPAFDAAMELLPLVSASGNVWLSLSRSVMNLKCA
jgi:hypothetical protein